MNEKVFDVMQFRVIIIIIVVKNAEKIWLPK